MKNNNLVKFRNKAVAMLCAIALMASFLSNEGSVFWVKAAGAGTSALPALMITEIYPDDVNRNAEYATTADLCEFVEIYNNTNSDINFNDNYIINYKVTTTDKALTVTSISGPTAAVIIPANGSAVFWCSRPDLNKVTESKFRTTMNVPLSVPVYSLTGQVGLNSIDREFNLVSKSSAKVISKFQYSSADVADGKSVELRPTKNENMEALNKQVTPTPGIIKPEQLVISQPILPRILITEICCNPSADFRKPGTSDDYEFIELYNNSDTTLNLKGYSLLYVYPGTTTAPKVYTFTQDTAIEPYSTFILWLGKYSIPRGFTTAQDFNANFNSNVKDDDILLIDNTAAAFNVVNSEYIRGYGISTSTNVADMVAVAWVDPVTTTSPDCLVQTVENSSITFTADSSSSKMTRVAVRDYATPGTLEEGLVPDRGTDIVAPTLSWTNETNKLEVAIDNELVMTSNEKLSKAQITYWSKLDTDFSTRVIHSVDMNYVSENAGVFTYKANVNVAELGDYYFQLNGTDMAGNISSIKRNAPGYSVTVTVHDDGHAPIITCSDDTITSINEGEELNIPYQYTEELGLGKVNLYYRTTEGGEFKCIETPTMRILGKYFAKIPADELLNCDYVDYYLEAFNIFRSTTTAIKKIKINRVDDFTGIRTNISENQIISGEKLITAKNKADSNIKVSVDGIEITKTSLIEKGAFFTISYAGNNSYFKNAVSVGTDILTYFAPWSCTMNSKAVLVNGSRFTYNSDGSAQVTLTLWAGTQGSAFEIGTAPNNDDYTATDMKLVLTDGTVLNADNGINPATVYKMGDSAGMTEKLDIHFTIPADKVDACGYVWNTKSIPDGEHTITMTSTDDSKTIKVKTDNTAPTVSANIVENDEIKGKFNAKFDITDLNGVNNNSLEVYLDDKILESPYSFVGSNLSAGKHTITARVSDNLGNNVEKIINFTTKNGYPTIDSAKDEKLADGSIKLDAVLGQNATNSTNVTFFEGEKYKVGDGIKVYSGVGDSTENSKPDALGTVTSDSAQYPYQVFEITTDGTADDTLQVNFDSIASYTSPLSAFVFNVTTNKWEKLTLTNANGKNTAQFKLADKVNNKIVKLMIQARAAESMPQATVPQNNTVKNDYTWDGTGVPKQYDFSFAWITDTQYYTESWPENFNTMNQWIVDNKKKQDIKYVIHTGDIVDEFEQDFEWKRADESMKIFENAGLPYGVLAGNHDVASGNEFYTNYWKYFGMDRFKNSPVYGESYKNNLGHYDLVTVDGEELIILYMGWDIYTDEVNWINGVLAKHSDRKAIICMHGYVNATGAIDYSGQLVQREVVAKNPNVFAVLNGHYHGAAINITAFDDNNDGVKDRNVYQICTDYQSAEEGGLSYIKMIYFDLQNNKVYMNSYSPKLNDFNFFDAPKLPSYTEGLISSGIDIYDLNVDFSQAKRSLTTNSFEANLFSTKKIGTTTKQDNKYSSIWSGLVNGEKYGWYANAENEFGLSLRSDISEFEYVGQKIVDPVTPVTPTPTPTIPEKIKTGASDTAPAPIEIANGSNKEFTSIKSEVVLSKATEKQKEALKKMTDEQIQAEIKKATDAIATVNTTGITEKAKEKIDEIKKELPADAKIMPINFTQHAEFAFPVQVTISVDKTIYPAGTYYLYYYNEGTGKVEDYGTVIVDADGNATFTISHCSDYFMSSKVINISADSTPTSNNPKTMESDAVGTMTLIAILSMTTLAVVSKKRRFKVVNKG